MFSLLIDGRFGVFHLTLPLALCCIALTGARETEEECSLVLTLGVAANVCYKRVRTLLTQETLGLGPASLVSPTLPLDQIWQGVDERSHLVCA